MTIRGTVFAAALALLPLAGCDGDGPTSSTPVPPNVAGTYAGYEVWLVQFFRTHDGFDGSFHCNGSITLTQSPVGALAGFAVVDWPCPAASFELSGSVRADGGVTFTTGSPRPYEGQCPSAPGVTYRGVISRLSGSEMTELSVRGSADVFCPGPGEGDHRFDYIFRGYR